MLFLLCCRYYAKNARGRLNNVPYVDNSWKWAGGGFLSTVGDLLQFGNAMLYSYQWRSQMVSYKTFKSFCVYRNLTGCISPSVLIVYFSFNAFICL
jgi:hypothetical protein